eukprot:1177819-Prorocentrum_minimum.AAC.4
MAETEVPLGPTSVATKVYPPTVSGLVKASRLITSSIAGCPTVVRKFCRTEAEGEEAFAAGTCPGVTESRLLAWGSCVRVVAARVSVPFSARRMESAYSPARVYWYSTRSSSPSARHTCVSRKRREVANARRTAVGARGRRRRTKQLGKGKARLGEGKWEGAQVGEGKARGKEKGPAPRAYHGAGGGAHGAVEHVRGDHVEEPVAALHGEVARRARRRAREVGAVRERLRHAHRRGHHLEGEPAVREGCPRQPRLQRVVAARRHRAHQRVLAARREHRAQRQHDALGALHRGAREGVGGVAGAVLLLVAVAVARRHPHRHLAAGRDGEREGGPVEAGEAGGVHAAVVGGGDRRAHAQAGGEHARAEHPLHAEVGVQPADGVRARHRHDVHHLVVAVAAVGHDGGAVGEDFVVQLHQQRAPARHHGHARVVEGGHREAGRLPRHRLRQRATAA